MKFVSLIEDKDTAEQEVAPGADLLRPLVAGQVTRGEASPTAAGLVIGELAALTDGGQTPLVLFAGQCGSAAVVARSVVPVQSAHVGRQVALMFEGADPAKPIILGVLEVAESRLREHGRGHVEVDADGTRLVVTAQRQIVLSCGKASITLTESGKVIIQGEYISSRASGVNRIKGGSVQIN